MADRRVTRTGKDRDGDITSLCGEWGSVTKATAIRDIDTRTNTYFVRDAYGRRADVIVVGGQGRPGRYLRTDPDATCANNLDNLPDC